MSPARTAITGLFFFLSITGVFAQLPDWTQIHDLEGNVYYLDRAGRVRITDKKAGELRAVTAEGIEYHLNRGLTCLRERRLHQGLAVLKSILAMRAVDNRIAQAQRTSAAEINRLKQREMERFAAHERKASLLLYREEGLTRVINDRMGYFFESAGELELIRSRDRAAHEYLHVGNIWGVRRERGKEGFDIVVTVDCERFKGTAGDIEGAYGRLQRVSAGGGSERKVVLKERNRLILSFSRGPGGLRRGFDGVFLRGNYLFMVRVMSSSALYEKNEKAMRDIIGSFRALPGDTLRDD